MDFWITKLLHLLLIFVSAYSQEVFNTMPPPVNTSFTCRGRDMGFYADTETNCRVYHTCDDHGNKFTYHCPEETAFRQEALVCDHAHLVDCSKGRRVSAFTEANEKSREDATPRSPNADPSFTEDRSSAGRSIDVFRSRNSNPAYTRSFRITAEPPSQFPTSKSLGAKQPTFVLNSSVYFRDRVNFQKSSQASRNNRVGTESSKDFEQTDARTVQESDDNISGKFSSASGTTTFRPLRVEFEPPTEFRSQRFGQTDQSDEFSGRFSSPVSSTTARPFGADFKVNYGNAMHSRPSSFEKQDESGGFFDRFSTTTFKPFGTNFKVDSVRQNPSEFRSRNSNKKFEGSSAFSSAISSTTFRPFGADFKVHGSSDLPSFGSANFDKADESSRMPFGTFDHEELRPKKQFDFEDKRRNDGMSESGDDFGSDGRNSEGQSSFGKAPKEAPRNWRDFGKSNERPSSFFDKSNFPYSETLRSMQTRTEKPSSLTRRPFVTRTTSASVPTAGTEFPVHTFTGSLAPLVPNELEDDPYYPKRSTTTEAYYKLSDRDMGSNRPYRFSTRRPWPGSLDFEIPDVLPDFNTLDDLVDRRKLFFIPRVKAT